MKSIRFVITVAFLSIILFLSISLLTLFQLSYREISTELSTYVSNTLAERTSDQLINMVNLPVELNRVEADAINLGLLDFNNAQKVNQYFWQNLRAYPILNAAFYANSNGDMFGSRHSPNDDAVFEVM